ncbi:MAG: hypothetical protein ACRC7S_10195, partial [Cetobacterium sp.]
LMDWLDRHLILARIYRNQSVRDLKNDKKIYRELHEGYIKRYDKIIEYILSKKELKKFEEVLK